MGALKAQEWPELAPYTNDRRFACWRGLDHDRLQHLPNKAAGLAVTPAALLEQRKLPQIGGNRAGTSIESDGLCSQVPERRRQVRLSLAQPRQMLGRFRLTDASVKDRGNRPLDLGLDRRELALKSRAAARCVPLYPPTSFIVVALNEIGDRIWRTELRTQAADDTMFDVVQIVTATIAAGRGLDHAGADDARPPVVNVLLRHSRAARAT